MSTTLIHYHHNLITEDSGVGTPPLTAVRNGSGGTSPAVDEDANWPMKNLVIKPRDTFWRSSASPASPLDVDFALNLSNTSTRWAGVAKHRGYGAGGITQIEVFTSGSTYPPGAPPAFTSRGTMSMTTADNDKLFDFGTSVTVRSVRFRITNSGQFSCKLHLYKLADIILYPHAGSAGDRESLRRIRFPERETLLGNRIFTELGTGVSAKQRQFRVPVLSNLGLTDLQEAQEGGFFYRHHDGSFYEVVYAEPDLAWLVPIVGTPSYYQTELIMEQLP